jgi:hypothetical protein
LCFSCDGGLTNWDPTDDPWTEHAKWFDKCPYLNLKKTQTFIEYAGRDQSPPLRFNNTDISLTNYSPSSEVTTNNSLLVQEATATFTEKTAETKIKETKLPDSGYSSLETEYDPKKSLNSKKLVEENERLKDEQSCRVCYNEESNILFLPCRHLVTCPTCAASVANCPVCRSPIETTLQVFKS